MAPLFHPRRNPGRVDGSNPLQRATRPLRLARVQRAGHACLLLPARPCGVAIEVDELDGRVSVGIARFVGVGATGEQLDPFLKGHGAHVEFLWVMGQDGRGEQGPGCGGGVDDVIDVRARTAGDLVAVGGLGGC